jgi:hypothetical protein
MILDNPATISVLIPRAALAASQIEALRDQARIPQEDKTP